MRNSIIESVDLNSNSYNGKGVVAYLEATFPALANLHVPFAMEVEEISPENEVVFMEGGSIEEEQEIKGQIVRWSTDAIHSLPSWSIMESGDITRKFGVKRLGSAVKKNESGEYEEEMEFSIPSIQRLMFVFKDTQEGPLPVVDPCEIRTIKNGFEVVKTISRYVEKDGTSIWTKVEESLGFFPKGTKIGWTKGCDSEGKVLGGCPALIVDGWLINGHRMVGALDGMECYGKVVVTPKGSRSVVDNYKDRFQTGLVGKENLSSGSEMALVRLLDTMNGVRFDNPLIGFGSESWGEEILTNNYRLFLACGDGEGLSESFWSEYEEEAILAVSSWFSESWMKKNAKKMVLEAIVEAWNNELPLVKEDENGTSWPAYETLPKPWDIIRDEKKESYWGYSKQDKAIQSNRCKEVAGLMREACKALFAVFRAQENSFIVSQFEQMEKNITREGKYVPQIEGTVQYDSCYEVGGKFVRQNLRSREELEKSWLK